MPHYLAPLWRLLIPALLITLAWYQLPAAADFIGRYNPLSYNLPYLLCATAAVIAYSYNRSRLFVASLFLIGAYWVIKNHLQSSLDEPLTFFRYTALCLSLALGLSVLVLAPEKGLWSRTANALLCLPLFTVFLIQIYSPADATITWLQQLFPLRPAEGFVMSANLSFLFAMCTMLCVAIHWRRNGETDAAIIACLVTTFLTLAFFAEAQISTTLFATAGLILIISLLRRSRELAFIDELTQLPGRRAFNEKLNSLGHSYSIAMIDIDHFKKFNDKHGHSVGDDVLKLVAARINQGKGSGSAYRYGGEEFAIIYNGKTVDQCFDQLDSLRHSVADYLLIIRDQKARKKSAKNDAPKRGATREKAGVNVTISIGVAERSEQLDTPEAVLTAADKALYKAKQAGRNRVCY